MKGDGEGNNLNNAFNWFSVLGGQCIVLWLELQSLNVCLYCTSGNRIPHNFNLTSLAKKSGKTEQHKLQCCLYKPVQNPGYILIC